MLSRHVRRPVTDTNIGMLPVELILRAFNDSIEARATCAELLAPSIVATSELMSSVLIRDSRILVCGVGSSCIPAQLFTTLLLSQSGRERPALPVILLDSHVSTLTAIEISYGAAEIYARQIQTLGRPQDLLLLYSPLGRHPALLHAVQAAHERNMHVVCLNGGDGGELSHLLGDDDVEVCIPATADHLVLDLHMLITQILCSLIEEHIFGEST